MRAEAEDASRLCTRPGVMARICSVALDALLANGVRNNSQALYANAVSFNQLLTLGTVQSELNGPGLRQRALENAADRASGRLCLCFTTLIHALTTAA